MNLSVPPLTDYDESALKQAGKPQAPPVLADSPPDAQESSQSIAMPVVPLRATGMVASVALAAIAGASVIQHEPAPPQYQGKLQLLAEPDAAKANQPSRATAAAPSIDYATQVHVLWSPKLLSPVVEQLQTQYPDLDYNTLSHRLKVSHRQGSKTIEVNYQDSDPARVQAVLQRISQAYIQYSQEPQTGSDHGLEFIQQRLPQVQQRVAIAQTKLQQFQQQYGAAQLERLGRQLAERKQAVAAQQRDIEIQRVEARSRYEALQQRLGSQADAASAQQSLDRQPRYRPLVEQFESTAIQLADELGQLHPDEAKVQSLRQHYKQLSNQLSQAVEQPLNDRFAEAIAHPNTVSYQEIDQLHTQTEWLMAVNHRQLLEISQQALADTEADLNQQIKAWADLARQHDELHQELQLATASLKQYVSKQAELQALAQPQPAWQVTNPPEVKQMPEQGFRLTDTQREISVSLLLCLLSITWAMSARRKAKPAPVCLPLPDLQASRSRQDLSPVEREPVLQPLPVVWSDSQPVR